MDEKTKSRFIKIANMMQDENEAVALQALLRCNQILSEHKMLWSEILHISQSGVSRTSYSDIFNNMWGANMRPETPRPQARARAKSKPKATKRTVSGEDIPTFLTGFLYLTSKYDGTSRGKKSFMDIHVIEKDGLNQTSYGPIRIFDEISLSSLDDLIENEESPTEYSLRLSGKIKKPYPPSGKIV